ncbi:hypothetical protein AAE478_010211 [Parahypoxylon ruwenzoriense]
MAPSATALEKDLRDGVRTFVAERGWDQVTVNSVRQYVEEKGELEDGFFKEPEWEARSKKIIKEFVAKLLAEEDEASSPPGASKTKAKSKNGVKRQSSEEPSPVPKRQKKAPRAAPSKKPKPKPKPKKEESESELSDLNDSSEFKELPKKATTKKATKKEDSDSELSDLDLSEDEPKKSEPQKPTADHTSKKEETESELSDLSDSEEEPKKKTNGPKKAPPRRKSKKGVKADEEEASDFEGLPAGPKRKRAAPVKKKNAKRAKVESDGEGEVTNEKKEASGDEAEPGIKADTKVESSPEAKVKESSASKPEGSDEETKLKDVGDQDTKPTRVDDSSSELSSVLDEPLPKKKRKSREPKGAPKSKQTKELSGDDAEIKKLQGQLVKCGVRKIWGIELKKYGDDGKAKIRHLRGMLRDIGVDGRFSEAKAKEIKERRELMADLEAVTEMNRNWGSEGGRGRASRSKAVKKSLKEESDDGDVKEYEDNGDNEEDAKANSRVSKRMADLAFLGSDSESE